MRPDGELKNLIEALQNDVFLLPLCPEGRIKALINLVESLIPVYQMHHDMFSLRPQFQCAPSFQPAPRSSAPRFAVHQDFQCTRSGVLRTLYSIADMVISCI